VHKNLSPVERYERKRDNLDSEKGTLDGRLTGGLEPHRHGRVHGRLFIPSLANVVVVWVINRGLA
jgi:hypothetical protein